MDIDKQGERLPGYIPQWMKRRIETDIYALYEFGKHSGMSMDAGSRVLDAGAGQGRFKADFSHTNYTAIDLAVGDANWDYTSLDAISDLIDLPFPDETFDAIFCTQVLEHVQEPSIVLSEFTRVLKPGGSLFLSAPQSWPEHQKPYDYFRYTSFGLRYLFEKAGLITKSIEQIGGYFWYLSFQFQNVNYWLFPHGMKGRAWTWPLRALLGLVFQLILPLILYYFDPLDRVKDETLGYLCIAVKPLGENDEIS